MTLPIALTMGEPGSIALETTFKAWRHRSKAHLPPFFLLDDPVRVARYAKVYDYPVVASTPENACQDFKHALPVCAPPVVLDDKNDLWASGTFATVAAVQASLEYGVRLAQQGRIKGITTNPVTKASLSRESEGEGQTEYLASLCRKKAFGETREPVMLFWGEHVRIALVTRHIPIHDIAQELSIAKIYQTVLTLATVLKKDAHHRVKKMALLGLNPHAGENGLLGDEEQRILIPALKKCQRDAIPIEGPFSADGFFVRAYRCYDLIVAMYHDQGLIPIKILERYPVNVTLGLPFVRTSPCHGTGRDIVAQNKADDGGLCAALRLCHRLCA